LNDIRNFSTNVLQTLLTVANMSVGLSATLR
jgi:hypothetical protein